MFDIDPDDKYQRILCYHPESDCYFEVFSMAEFANVCGNSFVDDVTDVEHHEAQWLKESTERYMEK